ncbi:MAG: hypothetical protein H0W78_15150 [Planctomycetes bacterium]|jgi:hypothetical protein|nr:hypothetical protein [Planctomycetota bacterium]
MLLARENPFRMQRIEALRYRLDAAGWQQLLTRFAANRWRGVLVGPHGSGKTTLREEIEARLRANGWQVRALVIGDGDVLRWSMLMDLITGAGERTLLSIDGLDRLGTVLWWRLRRAAREVGGILATSHVPGRLPTLHHHQTSASLLSELVHGLMADHGDDHAWIDQRCDELFARHHGDVRACLRSLYDDVGDQPTAS